MVKFVLLLILLMASEKLWAKDVWTYTAFPYLKASPTGFLPAKLKTRGGSYQALMPAGSATHSRWGVEQVYVSANLKKKLIVKHGVSLSETWPIGGWTKTGRGQVLHLRRGQEVTAFYAEGFANPELFQVEQVLRKFHRKSSASLLDALVPAAWATDELASPAGGTSVREGSSPPSQGQPAPEGTEAGESLGLCIARATGQELWQNATEAWESLRSADQSPTGAAYAAKSFLAGLAGSAWSAGRSGVRYASGVVADPGRIYEDISAAIDKSKEIGSELQRQVSTSVEAFKDWPPEVRSMVVCQLAGQLASKGVLSLALAATGFGAASAGARVAQALRTALDFLKSKSPTISVIVAAQAFSSKEQLDLLLELLKGTKSEEDIRRAIASKSNQSESKSNSSTSPRPATHLPNSFTIHSCVPDDCRISSVNATELSNSHVHRRHVGPQALLSSPNGASQALRNDARLGEIFAEKARVDAELAELRGASEQRKLTEVEKQRRAELRRQELALPIEAKSRIAEVLKLDAESASKKVTTVFPAGTQVHDVLRSLPSRPLRRIGRNEKNGTSRYQFTGDDGHTYEMTVCRRPPCTVDKETISNENELVSLYPCGAGVPTIRSLGTISEAIKAIGLMNLKESDVLAPSSQCSP